MDATITNNSKLTPPFWSGRPEEIDAKTFWTYLINWAKFKNIPDNKLVEIIPLFLKDEILDWFELLPEDQKSNFSDIDLAFKARFFPTKISRISQLTEIWHRKQSRDESVERFITDIQKLAKLGGLNQEDTILLAIIKGLKPEIRSQVMMRDPSDLKQLIELAKKAEENQRIEDAIIREQEERLEANSVGLESSRTANRDLKQSSRRNRRQILRKSERLKVEMAHRSPSPFQNRPGHQRLQNQRLECFKCGKPNHFYFQCIDNNKLCFKCGQTGHLKINCKTRGKSQGLSTNRTPEPKSVYVMNPTQTQLHEQNRIFIKVNHVPVKALLDSGAKRTLISKKFASFCKLKIGKPHHNLNKMYTANGQEMAIVGTALADIVVNELKMPVVFQVLENLTFDVIIGIDTLIDHKIHIYPHERLVTFENDTVGTRIWTPLPSDNAYVCVLEPTVVPPMSEAIVNLKINKNYKIQQSLLLPLENLYLKNIAMAKCLVSPTKHETFCKVMNPTQAAVVLKRNTRLGTIQPIGNNEIFALGDSTETSIPNIKTDKNLSLKEAEEIISELGIKIGREHLSDQEYCNLTKFLAQNQDLFAREMVDLPGTDVMKVKIDTGDAKPVHSRQFRVSPEDRREIDRQVLEMAKHNIISPSDSPWNSPCFLVAKHGTSERRLVLDFRKLNEVTKDTSAKLICFEEVVDSLIEAQARVYTTLDLRQGYYQMKLDEESAEKTSFTAARSRWKYNRLPMGIKGASMAFSALMHKILDSCLYRNTMVYLDDLVIYSRSMEQHFKDLTEVFQLIRQANLRLNSKKSVFAAPKVRYLGYMLGDNTIEADPEKIRNIQNFPRPTSVKALKSFLGSVVFFKRLIKDFSLKAAPLNALLKKNAAWEWTEQCENAFIELKNALMKEPILKLPDLNKELILVTDASKQAISYNLLQADDQNILHAVAYGGNSLSPAQRHYSTVELEMLAIITGCKYYHVFLGSRPFTCYTDHVSLTFVKSLGQSGNARLLRW